ncbi:MAG TPA: hypothetical protein VE033_07115 [Acetobacteraceae bacterium]|nr:hypothetical protein [Acetobacteraceae bacterium]
MGWTPLRRAGAFPAGAAIALMLIALLVMGAAATMRSAEYDESYTALVTSPEPRPEWTRLVTTPSELLPAFDRVAPVATTSGNLKATDVHPPLYFWAVGLLREAGGTSLAAQRGFSIALSLGAVLAWLVAFWRAGLPPVAATLLMVLAYGFAYTGHVARGFALAHLLLALCAVGAVEAWRRRAAAPAFLAGGAGGLAVLANYLAVFPAAGVLAWMVLAPGLRFGERTRLAIAGALPAGAVGLAAAPYFLAQRGARPEQFEAFSPLAALQLLAQFNAANVFGGLPLYVEGPGRLAVGFALLGLAGLVALLCVLRWRQIGPTRWLWLLGLAAPSAGLLALGAMAGNLPIELRYLAFAAPFAAALAAGGLAALAEQRPRLARLAFAVLVAVQAAGAAGMVLHPATRQAHRDALTALDPHLGPGSLLLAPYGNDGVGLLGATLREAPPRQPMLVLRLDDAAEAPARAAGYDRVVLLGIGERDGRAQAAAAREALAASPEWRLAAEPWADARRGFFSAVFTRAGTPSGMPDRAEGVVAGNADQGGEEAQRVGAAAVGERAPLHFLREQVGMLRERLRRAAHRLSGEDQL